MADETPPEEKKEEPPKEGEKKAAEGGEEKKEAAKEEKPKEEKKAEGDTPAEEKKDDDPPPAIPKKKKEKSALVLNALELLRGLWSRDQWTRRMAFLFFMSVVGVAVSVYFAMTALNEAKDAQIAQGMGSEEDEDAESEVKEKTKPKFLGSFTVSLRPLKGEGEKPRRGIVNMLEISVHIEVDKEETWKLIESHMEEVRDVVLRDLEVLDREYALTKDGKRRLRNSIQKILNKWLPHGEVVAVYFSKLLVG